MRLGSKFFFFSPEQFTGLFFPGMGLGLLMPKFFVSIKQIFGWPLPSREFCTWSFSILYGKRNFSGGAGSSLGHSWASFFFCMCVV